MKLKSIFIAGLALMSIVACKKEDGPAPVNPGKGLLNFSVSVPGSGINYSAKKSGPYQPGEVITIEIPSAVEDPVDITGLECFASIDNNCHADPAVPPVWNFTLPYQIKVVLADGTVQENTIKVVLAFPDVKITQVWQTSARTITQSVLNDMFLAVDDRYVYILDQIYGSENLLHVLDRNDGSYVKDIDLPTSFIGQVYVDEGGVLCCSRYNIYGAGFRFYTYDETSGEWTGPIIDYIPTETFQIPEMLGIRATLVGNVKEGTAYAIATAPNTRDIYTWKFTDGVPQAEPTITTYGAATEPWTYATARYAKAEPGADMYIAGINYVAYPNEDESYTYVQKKKSTGDIVSMKNDDNGNIGWRVLNFKTFNVGGVEMMALATQYGSHRYDGCQFKIFNISDESKWNLQPGDPGYNIDFCNFYTGIYGTCNYNMSTGIDVININDKEALIFLGNPSREAGTEPSPADWINCCVTCFKATHN